jgi:diadenosine tetraphosphate (Ap4A) HIT family hydrolase
MTRRTTDGDCPYCRIATGDDDPPLRVERDDALVAAPPPDHQLSKGHVVVFAPSHVEAFASLDPDVAAGLSRAAHFAATVMDEQFGAADVTILGGRETTASGHVHFDVVPRYPDDGLDLVSAPEYETDRYAANYGQMTEAFAAVRGDDD